MRSSLAAPAPRGWASALAVALLWVALSLQAAAPAPVKSVSPPPGCRAQSIAKTVFVGLPDGSLVKAELADTPRTREIGLMCRTKLPRGAGMLFAFPQEMVLTFWMKNTLISLDILWIGADKRVTVIHERLQASTARTPEDEIARAQGRGQYVLELAAGEARRRKLKAGDRLGFNVKIPAR